MNTRSAAAALASASVRDVHPALRVLGEAHRIFEIQRDRRPASAEGVGRQRGQGRSPFWGPPSGASLPSPWSSSPSSGASWVRWS